MKKLTFFIAVLFLPFLVNAQLSLSVNVGPNGKSGATAYPYADLNHLLSNGPDRPLLNYGASIGFEFSEVFRLLAFYHFSTFHIEDGGLVSGPYAELQGNIEVYGLKPRVKIGDWGKKKQWSFEGGFILGMGHEQVHWRRNPSSFLFTSFDLAEGIDDIDILRIGVEPTLCFQYKRLILSLSTPLFWDEPSSFDRKIIEAPYSEKSEFQNPEYRGDFYWAARVSVGWILFE